MLVVCSVAVHLVHANTNLFLSRKIDQLRRLSRLSLDTTAVECRLRWQHERAGHGMFEHVAEHGDPTTAGVAYGSDSARVHQH